MELDWCFDTGATFKDGAAIWGTTTFKVEKLCKIDAMTVKCFVEETMDVSDENTYFEWKVSNYLLKQWKDAKFKKAFFSPKFNAVGAEFYFGIYPNGWDSEGTAYLYLVSKEENEIHFGYYIGIEPFNHYQINFKKNKIKKGAEVAFNSPFKWKDIQNKSEITIGIKIWEAGSIEN
eukprot:922980_1